MKLFIEVSLQLPRTQTRLKVLIVPKGISTVIQELRYMGILRTHIHAQGVCVEWVIMALEGSDAWKVLSLQGKHHLVEVFYGVY
jgi:hypothetical protein